MFKQRNVVIAINTCPSWYIMVILCWSTNINNFLIHDCSTILVLWVAVLATNSHHQNIQSKLEKKVQLLFY